MRGLTALERSEILRAALPFVSEVPDGSLEIVDSLLARGLLRAEGDDEDEFFYATDLGALALRVCPVEGT